MRWLAVIALLAAIGAVTAGVFFWRKNKESAGSTWNQSEDLASSWTKTAAEKVKATADKAASAASDAADQVTGPAGS